MKIHWIQKQSAHVEAFVPKKLEQSIKAAFRHVNLTPGNLPKMIAHEAIEHLEGKGVETIDADSMRQAVMHVLRHHNEGRVAESYELTSLHMKNLALHGVLKRGGHVEPFHPLKLFKSIKKSFRDAGIEGGRLSEELTRTLISELEKSYRGVSIPSTEIKRRTAELLKRRGFGAAEKMYVLHKYL